MKKKLNVIFSILCILGTVLMIGFVIFIIIVLNYEEKETYQVKYYLNTKPEDVNKVEPYCIKEYDKEFSFENIEYDSSNAKYTTDWISFEYEPSGNTLKDLSNDCVYNTSLCVFAYYGNTYEMAMYLGIINFRLYNRYEASTFETKTVDDYEFEVDYIWLYQGADNTFRFQFTYKLKDSTEHYTSVSVTFDLLEPHLCEISIYGNERYLLYALFTSGLLFVENDRENVVELELIRCVVNDFIGDLDNYFINECWFKEYIKKML